MGKFHLHMHVLAEDLKLERVSREVRVRRQSGRLLADPRGKMTTASRIELCESLAKPIRASVKLCERELSRWIQPSNMPHDAPAETEVTELLDYADCY